MDHVGYPTPGPPLPELEIRLRVAQLGGWDKAEVLTPAAGTPLCTPLKWMCLNNIDIETYLSQIRLGSGYWFIYDIRERRCD